MKSVSRNNTIFGFLWNIFGRKGCIGGESPSREAEHNLSQQKVEKITNCHSEHGHPPKSTQLIRPRCSHARELAERQRESGTWKVILMLSHTKGHLFGGKVPEAISRCWGAGPNHKGISAPLSHKEPERRVVLVGHVYTAIG